VTSPFLANRFNTNLNAKKQLKSILCSIENTAGAHSQIVTLDCRGPSCLPPGLHLVREGHEEYASPELKGLQGKKRTKSAQVSNGEAAMCVNRLVKNRACLVNI